jgi:hypothetical protein
VKGVALLYPRVNAAESPLVIEAFASADIAGAIPGANIPRVEILEYSPDPRATKSEMLPVARKAAKLFLIPQEAVKDRLLLLARVGQLELVQQIADLPEVFYYLGLVRAPARLRLYQPPEEGASSVAWSNKFPARKEGVKGLTTLSELRYDLTKVKAREVQHDLGHPPRVNLMRMVTKGHR